MKRPARVEMEVDFDTVGFEDVVSGEPIASWPMKIVSVKIAPHHCSLCGERLADGRGCHGTTADDLPTCKPCRDKEALF